MPVCEEFKPEFILVSAGFDAHKDDPLGGMALTENGFGIMTQILMEITGKHSRGMLFCLEGGYHLEALKNSTREVLEVLQGKKEIAKTSPSSQVLEIIERVIKFNKKYWKGL